MFTDLKRWWQERLIRRSHYSETDWQQAFARLPLLERLTDDERNRLRRLAILFLHAKSLEGAGDLEVDTQLLIAQQLGYIAKEQMTELREQVQSLRRRLRTFLNQTEEIGRAHV